MASSYRSTQQTTNAARVSRVVLGPCTDHFRDILAHYIPQKNFQTKLRAFKRDVKPRLNREQRDMLYPSNTVCTTTYGKFDISLLYLLIRNMCGITPHSNGWGNPPASTDRSLSANIDRVREIRNKYCGHSPLISLSDPDFAQSWSDLRQITQEIEFQITGPSTKFVNEMDLLIAETMDPEQESYYLELMDKQKKTLDNLLDQQEKQNQRQVEQKQTQRRQGAQLETLRKSVSRETRKIQGKQRKLENAQFNQKEKIRRIDSRLNSLDNEAANVIANTESVLKKHRNTATYMEVKAVKSALEVLKEHKVLILSGKGGEGKTTNARHIMCQLSVDRTSVILENLDTWDKVVNSNKPMIVFLDDVAGRTNFDHSIVEKYRNKFDKILAAAVNGNVYVILALRRNILKDVRKTIPEHDLFKEKYEINLSSDLYKLTEVEKEKMMKNYIKHLQRKEFCNSFRWPGQDSEYTLYLYDVKKIIKIEPYYGFPQTCHLFFSKKDFFARGPGFFKHPDEVLFDDIESMRTSTDTHIKCRYCILAYVCIHQNINTRNIERNHLTKIRKIAKIVRIRNIGIRDIKDAIKDLQGPYLSATGSNDALTFSHETISEAVLLSFGQLSPVMVLQCSSQQTIQELIRTENHIKKHGEVVLKIPRRYYPDLAEKLFCLQTNCCFDVHDFMRHPATNDSDFTDVLFTSYPGEEKTGRYEEIIDCLYIYEKPHLLYSLLKYHRANDISGTAYISHEAAMEDDSSSDTSDAESNTNGYEKFIPNIRRLLWMSILNENEGNAIIICQYINKFKYFEYYENVFLSGCTVLHQCLGYGWDDVATIVLSAYTPQVKEICQAFALCLVMKKRKMMYFLCQHISSLTNAGIYFEGDIPVPEITIKTTDNEETVYTGLFNFDGYDRGNDDGIILRISVTSEFKADFEYENAIGFHVLHYCVAHGWEDVVDTIIVHEPTLTDRGWKYAHVAAFFGQFSLLKKFIVYKDRSLTDEGYSVLQCLLLRLRFEDFVSVSFSLDVRETTFVRDKLTLHDDNCLEMLKFLMSYPNSISDLQLPLDRYGNNIIHYLVLHDREKILDVLLQLSRDLSVYAHRNNTKLPTTLHLAIYLGRDKLAKKLYDIGVRPLDHDLSLIETLNAGRQYQCVFTKYEYNPQQGICQWDYWRYDSEIKLMAVRDSSLKFGTEDSFTFIKNFLDTVCHTSFKYN